MEPVVGFEPTTYALRKRCSTTELHRQVWARHVSDRGGRVPARTSSLGLARLYATAGRKGPAVCRKRGVRPSLQATAYRPPPAGNHSNDDQFAGLPIFFSALMSRARRASSTLALPIAAATAIRIWIGASLLRTSPRPLPTSSLHTAARPRIWPIESALATFSSTLPPPFRASSRAGSCASAPLIPSDLAAGTATASARSSCFSRLPRASWIGALPSARDSSEELACAA